MPVDAKLIWVPQIKINGYNRASSPCGLVPETINGPIFFHTENPRYKNQLLIHTLRWLPTVSTVHTPEDG